MRKLRTFASKKWHSIPVGAIALALVVSMAISGSAFAAYAILTGSGTANIVESITVTEHTPTDPTWTQDGNTGTWSFDIYPAQSKQLTLKISNAGVALPLSISITDADDMAESILVWDGSAYIDYTGSYTVDGSGVGYVRFIVTADNDAEIGAQTFTITITR